MGGRGERGGGKKAKMEREEEVRGGRKTQKGGNPKGKGREAKREGKGRTPKKEGGGEGGEGGEGGGEGERREGNQIGWGGEKNHKEEEGENKKGEGDKTNNGVRGIGETKKTGGGRVGGRPVDRHGLFPESNYGRPKHWNILHVCFLMFEIWEKKEPNIQMFKYSYFQVCWDLLLAQTLGHIFSKKNVVN